MEVWFARSSRRLYRYKSYRLFSSNSALIHGSSISSERHDLQVYLNFGVSKLPAAESRFFPQPVLSTQDVTDVHNARAECGHVLHVSIWNH